MMYRIRKASANLFSTGGDSIRFTANGKTWGSLSAFASHLAYSTHNLDKFLPEPQSLFKLYGDCVVIELPINGIGGTKEVPFKEWYAHYFATSEKFRAARKAQLAPVGKTLNSTQGQSALPAATKAPKPAATSLKWGVQQSLHVSRALELSSKFVPNLQFKGLAAHPKTGETFAQIEISGKLYALMEL